MRKLGYLGPRGTFSQEALKIYLDISRKKAGKSGNEKSEKGEKGITSEGCKGRDVYDVYDKYDEIEVRDYITIRDMLFDVENGKIEEAVVPLENSLEGSVNEILDIMANEVDLKYKAEVVVVIRQNLLVKKGTSAENIRCIYSHPQAIGQCRKYISCNFSKAEIKPVYSTAGAAELVAAGEGNCAAIGSLVAAEEYGLDVYARDIQDGENNFTRFAAVSRHDSPKSGYDKTSIVFSTEDKPGSLYKILDIFNLWDINMTRIESRPAKKQLGCYIFFVDIEGHRDDDDVRDALTMVKRKTSFYKFLGSYPRYRI